MFRFSDAMVQGQGVIKVTSHAADRREAGCAAVDGVVDGHRQTFCGATRELLEEHRSQVSVQKALAQGARSGFLLPSFQYSVLAQILAGTSVNQPAFLRPSARVTRQFVNRMIGSVAAVYANDPVLRAVIWQRRHGSRDTLERQFKCCCVKPSAIRGLR